MSNIIVCEGESEVEFLNSLKRLKMLKDNTCKIKKLKGVQKLLRYEAIYPGVEIFLLVHDRDDYNEIKRHIEDARVSLGNKLNEFYNTPNIDFLIAEMSGIYDKSQSKVLTKLKNKYGKNKKITFDEIKSKGGGFHLIKNHNNYQVLDLILFNV